MRPTTKRHKTHIKNNIYDLASDTTALSGGSIENSNFIKNLVSLYRCFLRSAEKTVPKNSTTMRKLFLFCICLSLFAVVGCKKEAKAPIESTSQQSDSLQKIIAEKDNEINDMMETFNQIEEGFREINEAENRVSIVKDGEGADKKRQLRENIRFIANTMKQNRALIEKLRQQMRESSVKGDQLHKTLDDLVKQLNEKDDELKKLRSELEAKDIHIAELDKTITDLNDNVSSLTTESSKKTETINAQDKQLNTAWFVFGTKRELKEQRIIDGRKVLEANFNKNYFTPLDYDVTYRTEIDGRVIASGKLEGVSGLAARDSVTVPFPSGSCMQPDALTTVEFCLKQDMPWGKKGFVQMAEQIDMQDFKAPAAKQDIAQAAAGHKAASMKQDEKGITVSGDGFEVRFDNASGSISSMEGMQMMASIRRITRAS